MNDKISRVTYGNPELAHVFEVSDKRINNKIELTDDDVKNKIVVYSNEPYAQELFDMYRKRSGSVPAVSKDMYIGESVEVTAKSYNLSSKIVSCEGVGNGILIIVPMSEFIYDVKDITADFKFNVVITKVSKGSYMGTCKNPEKYKEEIKEAYDNRTWFTVKLVSLIRGGYRALYKDTIECFVPGSHAAANIVTDFESLIGREMRVMVDNYDWSSRMYVVSYKKYVRQSMPEMIHELKFEHKYKGKLTSDPTDYGLFIELDGYYTGLAHRVDFDNYEEIRKKYKAGDEVDVYVKNVTEKRGNYRIVLTFDKEEADHVKVAWYRFKSTCENKTLPYSYSEDNRAISVTIESGETINISLPRDFDTSSLDEYKNIIIHKVNVIRQEIKFDFCK